MREVKPQQMDIGNFLPLTPPITSTPVVSMNINVPSCCQPQKHTKKATTDFPEQHQARALLLYPDLPLCRWLSAFIERFFKAFSFINRMNSKCEKIRVKMKTLAWEAEWQTERPKQTRSLLFVNIKSPQDVWDVDTQTWDPQMNITPFFFFLLAGRHLLWQSCNFPKPVVHFEQFPASAHTVRVVYCKCWPSFSL